MSRAQNETDDNTFQGQTEQENDTGKPMDKRRGIPDSPQYITISRIITIEIINTRVRTQGWSRRSKPPIGIEQTQTARGEQSKGEYQYRARQTRTQPRQVKSGGLSTY